jgi:hypothetical protein
MRIMAKYFVFTRSLLTIISKGNPVKFIKIALIVIVLIALVIVSIGYGLFELGGAIVDQANQPVIQTIQKSHQDVNITVPLEKRAGLKYESIRLCEPAGHEDDMDFKKIIVPEGYSPGYLCGNELCTIWIETHQHAIAEYISMYVLDHDVCKQQRFATKGHESILKYEATIEFTDELLQALNITASKYKIAAMHSNEVSSWQMMGNRKASFVYYAPCDGDDLSIDGVVKAHMIYK